MIPMTMLRSGECSSPTCSRALLPSVVPTLVTSDDDYLQKSGWYSLIIPAIFNIGDMGGRFLPAWYAVRRRVVDTVGGDGGGAAGGGGGGAKEGAIHDEFTLVASLARVAFVPWFFYCVNPHK